MGYISDNPLTSLKFVTNLDNVSFPTGPLQYHILISLSKESLGHCHRQMRSGFSFERYFLNKATGQYGDKSSGMIPVNDLFCFVHDDFF